MKTKKRARAQPLETFRKFPTQSRSRATVNIIHEATVRILETKNYQDITTVEIAKRAGVSVGSLYQYFRNKEGILNSLVDHYVNLHFARLSLISKRHRKDPLESYLAAISNELLMSYSLNTNLSRVILGRIPLAKLEDSRKRLDRKIRELIIRKLEILGLPIHHPRTEVSVYVFTRSVLGTIQAAVLENSPFLEAPEFAASLHWVVNASTELFLLKQESTSTLDR